MGQEFGLGLPDFRDVTKVSPGDKVISRNDLNKRKPPSSFLTLAGFWGSLVLPQITAFCHLDLPMGQFTRWQLSFLEGNAEESKREEGWQEKQDKCKPQTFF